DDPNNPLAYRSGEGHKQATAWTEGVTIKGTNGTTTKQFRFTKTHHCPIVGIRDKKPVAVRMAKLEESGMLEEAYAMGKAKSVAEFKAAMKPCAIPMFNTLLADTAGNICYIYNGAIPKRPTKFDWTKPVYGAHPDTE